MEKREIRTVKYLKKRGQLSRTEIRKAVKSVFAEKARKEAEAIAAGEDVPARRHWSEEDDID